MYYITSQSLFDLLEYTLLFFALWSHNQMRILWFFSFSFSFFSLFTHTYTCTHIHAHHLYYHMTFMQFAYILLQYHLHLFFLLQEKTHPFNAWKQARSSPSAVRYIYINTPIHTKIHIHTHTFISMHKHTRTLSK